MVYLARKIGIFGGTFNPPHNGHIHLAEGFLQTLGLDFMLMMPVWSPPHKSSEGMAPGPDRLAMCRLACQDRPGLLVSDIELNRRGKSYTCDTIRELKTVYPDDRLYLTMGADMFVTLESWNRFPYIAANAALCCAARHPGEKEKLEKTAAVLRDKYGAECFVADIPVKEVSSTQVRETLAGGSTVSCLVPGPVLGYIKQKGLYTDNP